LRTIETYIDNRSGEELSAYQNNIINRVVEETVRKCGADQSGEVCVSIVTNKEMHFLNKQYREVDKPTDVLSFPMDEEPIVDTGHLIYGDIIISLQKVREQAEEYGHSFERELGFLTCHGMLHLLGWDHMSPGDELAMLEQQNKILKEMELERQ